MLFLLEILQKNLIKEMNNISDVWAFSGDYTEGWGGT